MAKPVKHFGKWRIRWTDENGTRHSETYNSHKEALFALLRHENYVQEVKRGLRTRLNPEITFDDLCDYYRFFTLHSGRMSKSR